MKFYYESIIILFRTSLKKKIITHLKLLDLNSQKGKEIKHIAIDKDWTANVTLGGKDQSTLFITALNAVYILEMNVHGIR